MTKKEQVAYFAGLFDGEGCVFINKTWQNKRKLSPRYKLQVSITNSNPKPLIIIKQLYGGIISARRKNNEKYKAWYVWRVTTKSAENFLRDILPYLIIKKEEVELALIHRKFANKHRMDSQENKNIKHYTDEELKKQEKIRIELKELKRTAYVM